MKNVFLTLCFLIVQLIANSQDSISRQIAVLQRDIENLKFSNEMLTKSLDDVLWFDKLKDVAVIDKVFLTSLPPTNIPNPTAQGAKNPLRFFAYVFIPANIDHKKKYPLLILPHDGIHGNFRSIYTHVVRELVAQGYIIAAPEYRGSSGYGKGFNEQIDYGGAEVDDVDSTRAYMLENYDFIDKNRVGILGWSHGAYITLFSIFRNPEAYKVAFAGVPVTDLVARMGYKNDAYRQLFSANYHLKKTAFDNVEEYRKRSPVWHAAKLKTPLLIHTNTNDEDVNVLEVEHLIQALKAEGKKFEYEIYKDIPGGHFFDRMDTKKAKEIRIKIYDYLAKYLHPEKTIKNVEELNRISYYPSK